MTYTDALKCRTPEEADAFVAAAVAEVGGDPQIQRANIVYFAHYYGRDAGERVALLFRMSRQESIEKFQREITL